MDRPRYVDLYFGLSDSRNEAAEDRDAFVRTYVDIHGVAAAVVSGQKFLVLGPKGTGKSALAWYLEATEMDGNRLALVRKRGRTVRQGALAPNAVDVGISGHPRLASPPGDPTTALPEIVTVYNVVSGAYRH